MIPVEHPEYDYRAPEKFNWKKLDSIKIQNLALTISERIQYDLNRQITESSRIHVPGMRSVLNMIATTEALS